MLGCWDVRDIACTETNSKGSFRIFYFESKGNLHSVVKACYGAIRFWIHGRMVKFDHQKRVYLSGPREMSAGQLTVRQISTRLLAKCQTHVKSKWEAIPQPWGWNRMKMAWESHHTRQSIRESRRLYRNKTKLYCVLSRTNLTVRGMARVC